jgi:hypothetical protein
VSLHRPAIDYQETSGAAWMGAAYYLNIQAADTQINAVICNAIHIADIIVSSVVLLARSSHSSVYHNIT